MPKQLAKKRFSRFSRTVFGAIEKNPFYRWISARSLVVRWVIGVPVLVVGLFAWLTPIPGGTLLLLLAGAVLFPLDSFRSWFHRMTHRSRALSLYALWIRWRHRPPKSGKTR